MPGQQSVQSDIFKQEIKKNDVFGRVIKTTEEKDKQDEKRKKSKMLSPLQQKIEESAEAVRLLRAGKDLMDVIGGEMSASMRT